MNKEKWIGTALCFIGIAIGLYVGLWVLLVGGIFQLIHCESLKDVFVGVVMIIFSGIAGRLSALVFIIPGMGMIIHKRSALNPD